VKIHQTMVNVGEHDFTK